MLDEVNNRVVGFAHNMFKNKKMKYMKFMNLNLTGLYLNGLVARAERVCFKNVVF